MGILNLLVSQSTIPTPPTGKVHLFFDVSDGQPKYKDSTGTVNLLTGAVTSFNGRLGNVNPQQSDYDSFFLTPTEGDLAYQQLTANVLYVKTNPGTGEFSSIASALSSITTAAISNPFIIEVGPGIYTESTIIMKPYVYVVGKGQDVTVIQTSSASMNAVQLADNSYIGRLSITGATASGFAAIYYASSTSTATTSTLVEDVHFGANNILINNVAQGVPAVIICNNLRFGGLNFFDKGFVATNNGSGTGIIVIKSSSTAGGMSGSFSELAIADGSGCQIVINSGSFRTMGGGGNGNGIVAQNGGILKLTSVVLNGFTKAIYLPNTGASTNITADALNFSNNTMDIQVDHVSSTGYIAAAPSFTKTSINSSSSVYIVGKDPKIITVAKKGGDFTKITDAIAAISGSGPTNPFLIEVGPGVYTESLITIPPYVTITGGVSASSNLAIIEPDANNHHVIELGGAGCQISYITIRNAGSGFAGIHGLNATGFEIDESVVTDCDIGILFSATSSDCFGVIEHTNFTGSYTHSLQIVSTGGFISSLMVHGFVTLAANTNTGDDILIDGTQARLQIETGNITGSGLNKAIRVTNGGSITTKAFSLSNYTVGITSDASGSGAVVTLGVAIFKNISGLFINILNATTSGFYNGSLLNSQVFINSSSTWFVTGKNLQIITVAKRGGDFTSVSSAISSITDASVSKPYLVSIGPGMFLEPQIVMKSFVYVAGAGRQVTFLVAASVNQTTVLGIDNSGLRELAITGATGASGVGVYLEGTGTTVPFLMQNVLFGSNFTQISVFGNAAATSVFLDSCVMGGAFNFTNGFVITSNSGISTSVLLNNFVLQDLITPFPSGDIINISGSSSQLTINNSGFKIGTITGNGIVIYDGAQVRITGFTARGFTKAIWVQNTGVASTLEAIGVTLENNTEDLRVDHTSTIGSFNGNATGSKIFNFADDTFSLLVNDLSNGSTISSGTFKLRFPGNKDTDVSTLIIEASTMGNMEGGNIYDLHDIYTGRVVGVTAGFGYLEIEPEILKKVGWPEDSILVPANAESFIYYNSSGVLTFSSTKPDPFYGIYVGRVVTDSNSIVFIDDSGTRAEHTSNTYEKMLSNAFGPIYASGSSVMEGTTPLTLNIQSGEYYFATNKYEPSGASPISFLECYNNSIHNTPVTIIKVKWDNTMDPYSTLVDPTAGYYLKHTVYVVGEGVNEKYFVNYSQAQYATLLIAEGADIPIPPPEISNSVCLIASIIVQQGNLNIVEIRDERPRIGFKASGTSSSSDHQALSNRDALTAHSQYLLKANTDHMGIDLDLGGNSVVNVNLVDTVKVSAHEARHLPNGADPLATGIPISIGTSNSAGNANSFAISNHQHDHGSQSTPTHHAAADASNAGFLSATTQTIGGIKTFNSAPVLNSLTASLPLKLDSSKNVISSQIVDSDVSLTAAIQNTKLAISGIDGVLLNSSTGAFSLNIHGIFETLYVSPNDEFAMYTNNDPYDPYTLPDNRKITFATLESHLNLGNLTGKLPISKGGTNSSTALFNNRFIISTGGEIAEASAMTAGRVLLTDSVGLPEVSAITEVQLDSLSGISGNIQIQLNSKVNGANDGVKLSGTQVQLDIHGLTPVSFVSASDEIAIFSTSDPYLVSDNRKLNFYTFESHLNLNNLIGPLSVAKGGTNSTTALNNNRIMISTGGEITEASVISANRVIISDGSGLPVSSGVTETQIDTLLGISGNVQAQLNAKLTSSLGNSHINVGNSSNIATDVALSGDATIANTGVLTIANNAISNAKFRQSAGLSVVGNSAVGSGSVADITGTNNQVLRINSAGNALGFGAIDISQSAAVTGILAATNGGTGFASYAVGDILYASTTTALSKLADVATGSYLKSGGINTAPSWGGLDVDSQNANGTAATTTTSASLVDMAGATLTTAGSFTKNYNINFTGTFSHSANNVTMSIQLSINGSGITNTLRTIRVAGTAGTNFICSLNWTASIPVGQIVKIQWDTSGGTLTLQVGTITIFGVA